MKMRTTIKTKDNVSRKSKADKQYAKEQKDFNKRYKNECGICTTRKATPEELNKYFQ
jgi:hypothetical protein